MALHLSNFSSKEVQRILNDNTVMHLFATKNPRNDHNHKCLNDISSSNNPVARIKAHWTSTTGKATPTIIQHFKNPPSTSTLLCRGAMVRIVDKNFEPKWGLYNNAIGTILDIVFDDGHDPNNGDLPLYIVTEFKHYVGPIWYQDNPKVKKHTYSQLLLHTHTLILYITTHILYSNPTYMKLTGSANTYGQLPV